MAHVFKELVRQHADVRALEAGRRKDVDDFVAHHGPADDLPERVLLLLVVQLLVGAAVLGQRSLHRLQEREFVPVNQGLVQGAAQRKRLAGGQHRVGEALFPVVEAEHMVGHGRQQLPGLGPEVAVIHAVQHVMEHVHLLLQHGQCITGVDGRLAAALGLSVIRQRGLQFVGDADVVHDQTAWLVLEHPVHPGDGLHQVVAAHRLVDVHRVQAGCVESRQPHIPDDHELERVGRVLEALLQFGADGLGVDVRLQQRLVRGRTGHHHLDRALHRVVAVPVGAQSHDGVIEMYADVAAHGHHHRLAVHDGQPALEVRHDVRRHLLDARRRTDQLL